MDIRRLLAPVARRLRLLVSRGVVRGVTDASRLQTVQLDLLADEARDNVERFQQYGVTSHPHPGAEAIVVAVGGSRDHLVAIAVDDRRYRPSGLQPGEVCIYDDLGSRITLKRGGVVEIVAQSVKVIAPTVEILASTKVRVVSPLLECTGEIRDLCDTPGGSSMSDMRDAYNMHTHPGDSGGTTGTPNQAM